MTLRDHQGRAHGGYVSKAGVLSVAALEAPEPATGYQRMNGPRIKLTPAEAKTRFTLTAATYAERLKLKVSGYQIPPGIPEKKAALSFNLRPRQ